MIRSEEQRVNLLLDAAVEIRTKSHAEIESDTAWKWAARAIIAFEISSQNNSRKLYFYQQGEDYLHEAIEHAASASQMQEISEIRKWVAMSRINAKNSINNMMSGQDR